MDTDRSPLKESDQNPLKAENNDLYKTASSHYIIEDCNGQDRDQVPNPASLDERFAPIFIANSSYIFPDAVPLMNEAQMMKLNIVSSLSKRISWLAIVDCILVSFILYFGIFYLIIIVILLPVIGFFSSRRYHTGLSWFYLCYSVLILAMRCVLIYFYPSIPVFVIQGLIISLEAFIIYSVIRFISVLRNVYPNERAFLLGRPYSPDVQVNERQVEACVEVCMDPPRIYERINFSRLVAGK